MRRSGQKRGRRNSTAILRAERRSRGGCSGRSNANVFVGRDTRRPPVHHGLSASARESSRRGVRSRSRPICRRSSGAIDPGSMGVLIDASIFIEQERGRLSLENDLERKTEEFLLSVITVSELLHGAHRAVDAKVRARRSAWVEALIEQLPAFPIDVATTRTHARCGLNWQAKGG